jgi:hypothetical protein
MEGDPERSQWLVHMKQITKQAKSRVNSLLGDSYRLSQYFPHSSFLLVAPEEVIERLSSSTDVISVSHYDQVTMPWLKLPVLSKVSSCRHAIKHFSTSSVIHVNARHANTTHNYRVLYGVHRDSEED